MIYGLIDSRDKTNMQYKSLQLPFMEKSADLIKCFLQLYSFLQYNLTDRNFLKLFTK